MSLAHAIKQTMQAHNLSTAQVATHVGMEQDRATFYRMLNGVTTEPRSNDRAATSHVHTVVHRLGDHPIGVAGTGGGGPRKRRDAQGRMICACGKRSATCARRPLLQQWAVSLVTALTTALAADGERSAHGAK